MSCHHDGAQCVADTSIVQVSVCPNAPCLQVEDVVCQVLPLPPGDVQNGINEQFVVSPPLTEAPGKARKIVDGVLESFWDLRRAQLVEPRGFCEAESKEARLRRNAAYKSGTSVC
jgi:hypothetical protein